MQPEHLIRSVLPVILLIIFWLLAPKTPLFFGRDRSGCDKAGLRLSDPLYHLHHLYWAGSAPRAFWAGRRTFLIQLLLLGLGFSPRACSISKRRFAPLYPCAFAFGFMAIPLFSTVFGLENMGYLTSMGVGHELFIGLVFMPVARIYLKGETAGPRQIGKNLLSPLFVALPGLALQLLGIRDAVSATDLGGGVIDTISSWAASAPP